MKKFLSAFAIFVMVFGFTGCGGGGSGGDGVQTSDDPINDSVGGGDAANVQAFNKLKEYYNLFDDSAYTVYLMDRYRTYHPVTEGNKNAFVNNLVNNKKFYDPYSSGIAYVNTANSPLPSGVSRGVSVVEFQLLSGDYGYTIRNEMSTYNNIVSNDALYNAVFGTVNGNLVEEGFRLFYAGNLTADFTARIATIQAPPYNFTYSMGNLSTGVFYIKNEGGYEYMFYFHTASIDSGFGIQYAKQ
jgi:hypothetical protein